MMFKLSSLINKKSFNLLNNHFGITLIRNYNERRVVITGLGCLTPLGCGLEINWNKLINCETNISKLENKKYEQIPCKIAGIIPENVLTLNDNFTGLELKLMSKATLFCLIATEEAILNSKLNLDQLDSNDNVGVAIGTGMIDLQEISENILLFENKGYKKLSPYFITKVLLNMPAGHVSIKYKLKGPNHTVTTACATGAHAIGDSFNFIRTGAADVMICGGTESSVNPISLASFSRIRALATNFNDNPNSASRPFDEKRNGFVMSEGAGILVLEELEHAKKRNANILAEILGYGLSSDAHHITCPSQDGQGAFTCMNKALIDSNLDINKISSINCHATSTPLGDEIELKAIRKLFKDNAENLFLTSNKGSIGHLLGAAGAVESIFSVLSCKHAIIPPTLNLDKSLDTNLKIIKNGCFKWKTNFEKRILMKNSFGFGGTNACLIFSEFIN